MRNPVRRLRHNISGARQGYRNWLNRRAIERGRSPLPERITRPLRSSLPIYRERINPATGRPHRDDRAIGRVMDESLARRARRAQERAGQPRTRGQSR